MERSARWSIGLALGSLLVISGVVVAESLSRGEPTDNATHPEFGNPCVGTRTSLDEARDGAVFNLVEPQAPIANPKNLATVWMCGSVPGGVALVYDSGAAVLESLNDLKDPAGEWKGLADSYDEFSLGDVEGVPASFADPSVDNALGGVDLVLGDVRYTVSGNGKIPLDDLIGVARSLVIQAKAQTA